MANGHEKSKQIIEAATRQKKRNRNDLELQFNDGDNSRYLAHAVQIYNLPTVDLNDAQAVRQRLAEYFQICIENDMKANIAGVANALGVSRQYLWEISNGKTSKDRVVVDTIKKVYALLNQQMEDFMQNGKINPVAGIFLMKNNMGYKDEQEIVLSPNMEEKTPNDLISEARLLDDK